MVVSGALFVFVFFDDFHPERPPRRSGERGDECTDITPDSVERISEIVHVRCGKSPGNNIIYSVLYNLGNLLIIQSVERTSRY